MSQASDAARQVLFLIDRERLDEAEQRLGRALREAPEDFGLALLGARLDFAQGRLEQAESAAIRLLPQRPEAAALHFLLFEIARKREDHSEALTRIDALCRDHPNNADYATARAAQLLEEGRSGEAVEEAERALRLDPDNSKARVILAHGRLVCGEGDADQPLLERLRSDPDAYSTRHLLLTSLYHRGEYAEALKIAQGMLLQHPKEGDLLEIVKELRVIAHPSRQLFAPFDWLDRKGLKRILLIPGLIVGTLKAVMDGLLPEAVALPILGYLAAAGLWPALLRYWLHR